MMKRLFSIQFFKFAIVGATNTLISYIINVGVLLALSDLDWEFDYIVANIVAFILSVLWSFYWNNKFVFKAKAQKKTIIKKLIKSYVAYGFTGIILNNVMSTIWIRIFGISRYIAPLLNLIVSVPVNYILQKLWVFEDKQKK